MKLSKFTRAFTFLLIGVFALLATLFIIRFSEYIVVHFQEKGIAVPRYLVCAVGALLCIPCVVVLIAALPLSDAIEKDAVFTQKTADTLSCISKIMLVDCAAFFFVVAALFITAEFTISPILGIVDILGVSIAVLLRVLASYIRRAAEMKEEVDLTL